MDFELDLYLSVCAEHCGEDPPMQWVELAQLLNTKGDRGWRFEFQHGGEPMWAFGLGGTALLVSDVDLESGRFHLFEYLKDEEHFFDQIEELAKVLDAFERANRGLSSSQVGCIEDGVGTDDMMQDLQRELAAQDDAMDG